MNKNDLEYLYTALQKDPNEKEFSFEEMDQLSQLCENNISNWKIDETISLAQKALDALEDGQNLFKDKRLPFFKARFNHFLGEAFKENGESDAAIKAYKESNSILNDECADLFTLAEDFDILLNFRNDLGISEVHIKYGDWFDSLQYLTRSYLNSEELYNKFKEASNVSPAVKEFNNDLRAIVRDSMDMMVDIAMNEKIWDRSIFVLNKELDLFEPDDGEPYSRYARAVAHNRIGTVYLNQGKFSEAKEEAYKAISLLDEADKDSLEEFQVEKAYATSYLLLGETEMISEGDAKNALKVYEQAIKHQNRVVELRPNRQDELMLLGFKGNTLSLYQAFDQVEELVDLAEETLEGYEQFLDEPEVDQNFVTNYYMEVLRLLGYGYLRTKRSEEALEAFNSWLKLAEKNQDLKAAGYRCFYMVLLDRAYAHRDLGMYGEAFADAKDALSLVEGIPRKERQSGDYKMIRDARRAYNDFKRMAKDD